MASGLEYWPHSADFVAKVFTVMVKGFIGVDGD
jgi:hypothetical protein